MGTYHRNDIAGPVLTSMVDAAGSRITMTFASLKADLDTIRATGAAAGITKEPRSVGKSEKDKDIHLIRIGKNEAFPVLIVGCHHAREWISVEIPFLFAKFLVEQYATNKQVHRIVDSMDLWIVPMVNPDGHEESVLTNRQWRKNSPPPASGRPAVDLNRNYSTVQWDITVGDFSDLPGSEIYRGPSKGFAKEVQVLQSLVTSKTFKGLYDFHSYGRWVLYPWFGRVDAHPNNLLREIALSVERVIDHKGQPDKDYVEKQGSKLYAGSGLPPEEGRIPGDFGDFTIETHSDALVLGIELEPGPGDPRRFVLPEAEIESVFDLHREAILAFLNCLVTLKMDASARKNVFIQQGSSNNFIFFRPEGWRPFL